MDWQYNLKRSIIVKFFKWLYYPDIESTQRPNPKVVENIARLKRKEQSIYKPTDLWSQEDDLLFLKYCPSKRDRCYHTISRDLSCRPHEILNLCIKDIAFKTTGNCQYADVSPVSVVPWSNFLCEFSISMLSKVLLHK